MFRHCQQQISNVQTLSTIAQEYSDTVIISSGIFRHCQHQLGNIQTLSTIAQEYLDTINNSSGIFRHYQHQLRNIQTLSTLAREYLDTVSNSSGIFRHCQQQLRNIQILSTIAQEYSDTVNNSSGIFSNIISREGATKSSLFGNFQNMSRLLAALLKVRIIQGVVVVQWLVSLPLDCPSRVCLSAWGLPKVQSEGRQITL